MRGFQAAGLFVQKHSSQPKTSSPAINSQTPWCLSRLNVVVRRVLSKFHKLSYAVLTFLKSALPMPICSCPSTSLSGHI